MKKTFLFIIAFTTIFAVHAQTIAPNILNSAGGSVKVNGVLYDWSFAEMTMINTVLSDKLIVTQGILQTRTDTAGTGISDVSFPGPEIIVFPNPTQNSVRFEGDYSSEGRMQYTLTDIQGKVIQEKRFVIHSGKDQQTIDLSELCPGTYLLNFLVEHENRTFFKTSKIQKNN